MKDLINKNLIHSSHSETLVINEQSKLKEDQGKKVL